MKIVWRAKAESDRLGQIEYLDRRSRSAAKIADERITRQVLVLLDHPLIGRSGKVRGTRELVISRTNFIAIYQVTPVEVTILRLIHGKQRWPPRRRNRSR